MDEEEIRRRVDELDAAVTREEAQLVIYCEDIEQQTCELVGNRKGYLRTGIELLRAAIAPMRPGDSITPVSVDYLIRSDRSLRVTRLTRQEDVEAALPPLKGRSWKDKAIGIGCLIVVVLAAVCMFIGIGMVSSWIFGR